MTSVYVVFHTTECKCTEEYDELVSIVDSEEKARRKIKFLTEEFGEPHRYEVWNVQ